MHPCCTSPGLGPARCGSLCNAQIGFTAISLAVGDVDEYLCSARVKPRTARPHTATVVRSSEGNPANEGTRWQTRTATGCAVRCQSVWCSSLFSAGWSVGWSTVYQDCEADRNREVLLTAARQCATNLDEPGLHPGGVRRTAYPGLLDGAASWSSSTAARTLIIARSVPSPPRRHGGHRGGVGVGQRYRGLWRRR